MLRNWNDLVNLITGLVNLITNLVRDIVKDKRVFRWMIDVRVN